MRTIILPVVIFFLASAAWGQAPARGQTREGENSEKQIRKEVDTNIEIRQKTQQAEDEWARQKAELEARYKAARAGVAALEKQKAYLEKRQKVLEKQLKEIHRRITESEKLETGLENEMESTLSQLEEFINNDLPFLPEERSERINSLKQILASHDISPAEKLRRLLEAVRIESEYGDSVETYQQKIRVNNKDVFADILKVGRISVFWQTPDGRRVGEYDRVDKKWIELPSKYSRDIKMAFEMADRKRPMELIKLPIGRISP